MEGISVYGINQTPYDQQKYIFIEKLKIAQRELIKLMNAEGIDSFDEEKIKKSIIKLFTIEKQFTDGD